MGARQIIAPQTCRYRRLRLRFRSYYRATGKFTGTRTLALNQFAASQTGPEPARPVNRNVVWSARQQLKQFIVVEHVR